MDKNFLRKTLDHQIRNVKRDSAAIVLHYSHISGDKMKNAVKKININPSFWINDKGGKLSNYELVGKLLDIKHDENAFKIEII